MEPNLLFLKIFQTHQLTSTDQANILRLTSDIDFDKLMKITNHNERIMFLREILSGLILKINQCDFSEAEKKIYLSITMILDTFLKNGYINEELCSRNGPSSDRNMD